MALAVSLAMLIAAGCFAIVAAAAGHRLLRILRFELSSDASQLLCSVAVGVIGFQILVFFSQPSGHIRWVVIAILVLAATLGVGEYPDVSRRIGRLVQRIRGGSKFERVLVAFVSLVLWIEGLAAMAPLTGSDALHYHFTAPLLVLQSGFHPNFFLSHSFLCGQSHLLILSGLALGSDQLAMAVLFLGGVLSAAACASLTRSLAGREWGWVAALVFLLTPVVFWQISAAGSPDLWMAFFSTLAVMAILRTESMPVASHAAVVGFLAGGVAGAKYTGCMVTAAIAVAFAYQARPVLKSLSFFVLAALTAGIWPYARNLVWTGDPVFPFLTKFISPTHLNAFTFSFYRGDTGAGDHHSVLQVLAFPLFAVIDPAHLGFWQYLGPIVLSFAPFVLLARSKTPLWRAILIVWILSAVGIGWSSGMIRFLLPILPIAFAAVLAWAARLTTLDWRIAHWTAATTLCSLAIGGFAGLLLYDRSAMLVTVGLRSREEYLRARAPEYQDLEFIQQALSGKEQEGKTLTFLRHTYYLRVPYLYGDPMESWAMNPAKLQTREAWMRLFRSQNISWIVRAPEYPPIISAPLRELEASGTFTPVAEGRVSNFRGMRISGVREEQDIVIFRINY